ncbi:hypothetical protein, partial [Bacillus cereus group sp. BC60]|uniref:hypothetical protein n=1 Tax=Bacillus cereus group sp. BC60 TaxID=3445283 RepID=UPI003F235B71
MEEHFTFLEEKEFKKAVLFPAPQTTCKFYIKRVTATVEDYWLSFLVRYLSYTKKIFYFFSFLLKRK